MTLGWIIVSLVCAAVVLTAVIVLAMCRAASQADTLSAESLRRDREKVAA